MFDCCVCEKSFAHSKALLSHISFFHSDFVANKELCCTQPNCVRGFTNFKSFCKHVESHDKDCTSSKPKRCKFEISNVNELHIEQNQTEECSSIVPEFTASAPELSTSVSFDNALSSAVVTFVASLYDSNNLSETQIQLIIDAHKKLLGGGFLSVLRDHVCNLVKRANSDKNIKQEDIQEVIRMFDSCENMFAGFDTQYLRLREFESSGCYIKPESYTIGHAVDERRSSDGQTVIKPIELTGQFIPMRKVLKGFLELPNVLSIVCKYKQKLEETNDGYLCNLVQGSLWKEKIKPKFGDKCVLPLTLYFDEYETNKELGTHTGVHKIGATYFRIGCLPLEFQSSLDNIFVANLFHSSDRAFGNAKVFRKVVNELKYLESCGITVVTSEGSTQVYFALCLVTGDNLGANAILGFVESFSANYYCRICKEHKIVMQTQIMSNPAKRRTKDGHLRDIVHNNESETGVKGECVFNEVDCFDNTENIHLDIMHDLDEGAWNYLLCAVISYFLKAKRFDLEELNNLVQGFNFGMSELGNKPPFISKDHLRRNKLACSASEMRCLMRYFGLIVGHLVQSDDSAVWKLYLTARKIIDIVTAPRIPMSHIGILRGLIEEHHSNYLKLFNDHLYPKMHFMTHQPDIIPEIGPLEPVSCIRPEAKHKEGKKIAHTSCNRINLPYTIAKRQQLKLCFRLLCARGLTSDIEASPIQEISLQKLVNSDMVLQYFDVDVITTGYLKTVKWVKIHGTKYTLGCVLIVKLLEGRVPQFGEVHAISFEAKGVVKFLLKGLKTVCFDEHFHAYAVDADTNWFFVEYHDLYSYTSTDIITAVNGNKYVALRYSLF